MLKITWNYNRNSDPVKIRRVRGRRGRRASGNGAKDSTGIKRLTKTR